MDLAYNPNLNTGKQEVAAPPDKPLLSMNSTMKAIVWRGKYDVRYEDVPRPLLTDQRDVILKITGTTICGSDCHLYSGAVTRMHSGDVLGHEFMGLVTEVGSLVKNVQLGDRVVVAFDIACGECAACKRQEYTGCLTTNQNDLQAAQYGQSTGVIFGYSHNTGGVPGGQAEYVRVPFADTNCLKLPEEIPDNIGLFLSDIIPTSYFGIENAEVKSGDVVAIWGLGPVGLLACRWAQIKGAAQVIGIDRVPERLELAKKSLGVDVINYDKTDVYKTLMQLYPNGVDAGLECVGSEYAKTLLHKTEMQLGLEQDTGDILSEIISCVRPFGKISVVGVYVGYTNHFPIGAFMEKGQTMRGGQCPSQRYWKDCLKYIASGEMDPRFTVTTYGRLSDAVELYKTFYAKEKGVVKVFLRPDDLPISDFATPAPTGTTV